ncbi:MAG: DNA mismatch repair protein MutS, partial [Flavobacteriales bacterium]|nr:DNA mismatch repair protein MutS [Flavobacteriales bacterium]
MKQYNSIKSKYPDALLLFRVGDFYEMFGDDAVKASKILGIVLTKRKNGAAAFIDLAGFPHHSLDVYLPKLVRAGNRVAICDQLEDPKLTKKIVKRGVTELVTPGVSFDDNVLDTNTNNFLAAVVFGKNAAGVSFLDISTGEFLVAEGSLDYVDKLLQTFKPNELLFKKHGERQLEEAFGSKFYTHPVEDWVFTEDFAREKLTQHFETSTLKGFGVEELTLGVIAGGAALHYLTETKHDQHAHIQTISRVQPDRYIWLDRFTIQNLELVNGTQADSISLLDIIDHTVSPMGGRLMKRWTLLPSKEKMVIESRHEAVQALIQSTDAAETLSGNIRQIGDLERLIGKVA